MSTAADWCDDVCERNIKRSGFLKSLSVSRTGRRHVIIYSPNAILLCTGWCSVTVTFIVIVNLSVNLPNDLNKWKNRNFNTLQYYCTLIQFNSLLFFKSICYENNEFLMANTMTGHPVQWTRSRYFCISNAKRLSKKAKRPIITKLDRFAAITRSVITHWIKHLLTFENNNTRVL